MRPTPAESLFCGSSASVFDGLRDVSVAEVLDQADADQGHDEQAGEHRNQRGVAVGLIRRVGNYERGQLVAGQTGERPGAQRQTVRGGDGFGAEVRPIGTFVVLITVARPCGSRRVGLSFLSRGK